MSESRQNFYCRGCQRWIAGVRCEHEADLARIEALTAENARLRAALADRPGVRESGGGG